MLNSEINYLKNYKERSQKKQIFKKMVLEVFFIRPWIRLIMMALSIIAATAGVLGPYFQKEFIDLLAGKSSSNTITNLFSNAYLNSSSVNPTYLLLLSFGCVLLSLIALQIVSYLGAQEAIYLQQLWSQRIYNHILELRSDTLSGRPIGEIVSIYTTDIPGSTIFLEQSFPQAFSSFFPILTAPFVILTVFNTPILQTLLVMIAVIGLNFILAFRQSRFFYNFKRLAAQRVGLVNEWIQNIRTIRILGWVEAFEKRIFKVREVETQNRVAMLNNGQTMNAIASSITFVLNFTVIYSFISTNPEQVTPGALLALLWIVAVFLTRPFRQMPWLFTFVFDGISSLNRTANLFAVMNAETNPRDIQFRKLNDLSSFDPAIEINNLNLKIHNQIILDQLNFKIGEGEFIAIVGEVGSGKSLLLLSLLGETGATFSNYKIGANDAKNLNIEQLRQFYTFVPQEGFIMSASLRENIAFNYNEDSKQDSKILNCLSHVDFNFNQERIPQGLETEIGERGVNLSGGQKQRVSLARVDFHTAPIILLDDCLSAVDIETENKIMNNLLLGEWQTRTRVLVTHRLTVLPKVDRVFFMKNGKLIDAGSFSELSNRNSEFRLFTASIEKEASSESAFT